jgi:hypothetical protein
VGTGSTVGSGPSADQGPSAGELLATAPGLGRTLGEPGQPVIHGPQGDCPECFRLWAWCPAALAGNLAAAETSPDVSERSGLPASATLLGSMAGTVPCPEHGPYGSATGCEQCAYLGLDRSPVVNNCPVHGPLGVFCGREPGDPWYHEPDGSCRHNTRDGITCEYCGHVEPSTGPSTPVGNIPALLAGIPKGNDSGTVMAQAQPLPGAVIDSSRPSLAAFMSAAKHVAQSGNTPWAARYANELRQIVIDRAENAPRNLQRHLGPSEIGVPCDRQVVGKLVGFERTNHVTDVWPSIVGTAVHAWMEDTFNGHNDAIGWQRWLVEQRVTAHPDHAGTSDLFDMANNSVVDHKGVHVDTPIATPDGWTTMGRLNVGDQVFGMNGQPCRVTEVYPVQMRDCYRIKFTDGTSLVTDDIQELPFYTAERGGDRPTPMSVQTAVDHVWSPRPQRQLRMYNGAALELPSANLLVHPYVLGCWLGDGSVHGGTIGSGDAELFEHIESCGYTVGPLIGKARFSRTVYGLSSKLQQLGLQWPDPEHASTGHGRLYGHKRLPDEYLRASTPQRLALLQGLMDTDGSWNKARNQAVFVNTDKTLAESVAELITTLGWKAQILPQQATGFGRTVTVYHVAFTPFDMQPFRLRRKASQVRLEGSRVCRYRIVESIEQIPSVPTRCIDVDSPDHLYRCGEQMIPVHNCLGETSMAKLRADKVPPQYFYQLLTYRRGYQLMGLRVDRIVIIGWPRTGSSVDGMYVWEHECTPEDDVKLDTLFARMQWRKQWAAAISAGNAKLSDVPAVPDSDTCYVCPFYRPQAARDGGPGCPGHAGM